MCLCGTLIENKDVLVVDTQCRLECRDVGLVRAIQRHQRPVQQMENNETVVRTRAASEVDQRVVQQFQGQGRTGCVFLLPLSECPCVDTPCRGSRCEGHPGGGPRVVLGVPHIQRCARVKSPAHLSCAQRGTEIHAGQDFESPGVRGLRDEHTTVVLLHSGTQRVLPTDRDFPVTVLVVRHGPVVPGPSHVGVALVNRPVVSHVEMIVVARRARDDHVDVFQLRVVAVSVRRTGTVDFAHQNEVVPVNPPLCEHE